MTRRRVLGEGGGDATLEANATRARDKILSGFVIFQSLAPRKISLPVQRPPSAHCRAFRSSAMAKLSFETSAAALWEVAE
jgi:hypothetical protein